MGLNRIPVDMIEERGTGKKLNEKLDDINSSLAEIPSYVGTNFEFKGIAFPRVRQHNAWAYSKYKWDANSKEIVSLSMEGTQHGKFEDVIYFRKRTKYGDFSDPIEVANLLSQGIGCTCQAFGIAANGDYIALIGRAETATSNILGTWVYRSIDKGNTWTNTPLMVDGGQMFAKSNDVDEVYTLNNGRLLSWGWFGDNKSFIIYSDDNGVTWHYGTIGDGTVSNTLEPAFCELDDGTIIAILRNGVSSDFTIKKPALFSKSTDGGITWSTPIESTTILDMTENNGTFIKRPNSNIIEFINCSRFDQEDGYKSIYQSVFTQDQAKQGIFGSQKRILQGAGYAGDFGYPASLVTDDDEVYLFYYTGYSADSNICYLVGRSGTNTYKNQPENFSYQDGKPIEEYKYTTNSIIPMNFEQGTFNTSVVGQMDTEAPNTDGNYFLRVRLKDYVSTKSNTQHLLKVNDPNLMVTIKQYDSNYGYISETGMQTGSYYFTTDSNCAFTKCLIRRVDGGTLFPTAIKVNSFTLETTTPIEKSSSLNFTGQIVQQNGFVERWGTITVSTIGDNSFDVTFPAGTFTTCYQVQATFLTNGTTIANNIVSVGNVVSAGFKCYSRTENTGYIYWRAIGKQ